jgi:hypothetical protein
MIHMKLRLYLSLLALTLLFAIGAAHAQSLPCVVAGLDFPSPNQVGMAFSVDSGACLASTSPNDRNGPQTGRLRWDDNKSGKLELFDTDDGGALLWCGHLHDGNGPCAVGKSLCLQWDGNMVIYSGTGCSGSPQWASNTNGENEGGEFLFVGDKIIPGFDGGEVAVIVNDHSTNADTLPQIIWESNNSD